MQGGGAGGGRLTEERKLANMIKRKNMKINARIRSNDTQKREKTVNKARIIKIGKRLEKRREGRALKIRR